MTDSVTLSYVAELRREVEALRQELKSLHYTVEQIDRAVVALTVKLEGKPELPRR
jgi:hypothetical protein